MGNKILKQANGKYAVFSTVVDDITHYDCDFDELVEAYTERDRCVNEETIKYQLKELTYDQAALEKVLSTVTAVYGKEAADFRRALLSGAGRKKVVVLGGGTNFYISNHLALSAPAYGATARRIAKLCNEHSEKLEVQLFLTQMAGPSKKQTTKLETLDDVSKFVDDIVSDLSVKIVFFNAAIVDYAPSEVVGADGEEIVTGKYAGRIATRDNPSLQVHAKPSQKVIQKIREKRKDIFLVGFKATCGATEQEQFTAGLHLLKEASCNLVLANDTATRFNMVITPEEAAYHRTTNRDDALRGLVEMAYLRSHLTFTRSTVIAGESIPWASEVVPGSLRKIVDHCIEHKAYKAFRGSTVGHFAVKVDETTFLTSKRKTDFNQLYDIGLVKIRTDGPDSVLLAYGSKPSVGGQSQRIIFNRFPNMDCIVHFHCPLKPDAVDKIPVMSQREYECGSHQCGQNTANGLGEFALGGDVVLAVFLEQHGPNIVFNRNIDPNKIIGFINRNFDLSGKTGGYTV